MILCLLLLSGCGDYDAGYDEGYDGETPSMLNKLSGSYNDGYADGKADAYYYELGYQDARNDEKPRYPDIEEYMEG